MHKILVVAPHPDDEILGCAGMMMKNIKAGNEVYVCVVTKGCPPLFSDESVAKTRAEMNACHQSLGITKGFYLDFPAAMLDGVERYKINKAIQDVVGELQPTDVYIPFSGDLHFDHQIVSDACMVALRPKNGRRVSRILAYETLSETGWNTPGLQHTFEPTIYEDISRVLDDKLQVLSIYQSQLSDFPATRSLASVEALARYRGAMVNLPAAEAYMLIREINE